MARDRTEGLTLAKANDRRFDSSQNANLVLKAERHEKIEEEDEIGSLWGHINPAEFGDKASRERPPIAEVKKTAPMPLMPLEKTQDNLEIAELATLHYRPKTSETRAIYEKLLRMTMDVAGEDSATIGRALLDESLLILLSPDTLDFDKKTQIERLFMISQLDPALYSQFSSLSKRLIDWESSNQEISHDLDEEESFGLMVVDTTDIDTGEYIAEVEPVPQGPAIESLSLIQPEASTTILHSKEEEIDIRDVDAHYVQRMVSQPGEEPWVSHERATAILALIQDSDLEGWNLESRLMKLFPPTSSNYFDVIAKIIVNRLALVAGTALSTLGPLGDEETRQAILEALIAEGPKGAAMAQLVDTPREGGHHLDGDQNKDMLPTKKEIQEDTKGGVLATIAKEASEAQALVARKLPLPPGSWRKAGPGYELIHVPAPIHTPPEVRDAPTLSVTDILPDWAFAAWENMPTLNRIQSAVFEDAFNSDRNLLVSAPTGAGKTGIALLSLLRFFGQATGLIPGYFEEPSSKPVMAVYIAPMRALVREMCDTFNARLNTIWDKSRLIVSELTGESGGGLGSLLAQYPRDVMHLIIATPEKWDIVSRKMVNPAPLIIIDEIHLLGEAPRGTVLEALIARYLGQARILALSATLPNAEQVGHWLDASIHCFGPEWRPCPLALSFFGILERKASKRIATMNEILLTETLERISQGPILVFVHSRRETGRTARFLRDNATQRNQLGLFSSTNPSTDESPFDSSELNELAPAGIGIHHAGLSRADRNRIETLFSQGSITLLVCTATLAWGVNLPAHTVIIKGTDIYDVAASEAGGSPCWAPLSAQDVLQMWGRAGRPQYDRLGEALLLTEHQHLPQYVAITAKPVISQMLALGAEQGEGAIRLLPHLAAEISRGHLVSSRTEAITWVTNRLFLGYLVRKDPAAFFLDQNEIVISDWIASLVASSITLLVQMSLVEQWPGGTLLATDLGQIATEFYLSPLTIRTFVEGLGTASTTTSILELVCRATELAALRPREEELDLLDRMADALPLPLDKAALKAPILLQAIISRLPVEEGTLAMDAAHVALMAPRLLQALVELAVALRCFGAARSSLLLARSVTLRCWPSSSFIIQLLPEESCSATVLSRLERRELSLAQARALTPKELTTILPPDISVNLSQLPEVHLSASAAPISHDRLDLTIMVQGLRGGYWLFVTELEEESILYFHRFPSTSIQTPEAIIIETTIVIPNPPPPGLLIHLISEQFHHCDALLPISFRSLVIPLDEPVSPVRLQQLAPLSLAQLREAYQANPLAVTAITNADNTLLTAAERHLVWMLRRDQSSLVVGLPLSNIADGPIIGRIIEAAIGFTEAEVVLIASPWKPRRAAVAHSLRPLDRFTIIDGDEFTPNSAFAVTSQLHLSSSPNQVVVMGDPVFLYQFLLKFDSSQTKIKLIIEWGIADQSMMLYQELLLMEAAATDILRLLLAPSMLTSLQSLGSWLKVPSGRIIALPSPIEPVMIKRHHYGDTIELVMNLHSLFIEAIGGLVLFCASKELAAKLADAMVVVLRSNLVCQSELVSELLEDSESESNHDESHLPSEWLQWLALGIGVASDQWTLPISMEAFRRGLISALIIPLDYFGGTNVLFAPERLPIRRIISWVSLDMDQASLYLLNLALSINTELPSAVVNMGSKELVAESILLQCLSMAIPSAILEDANQALEWVGDHSWLVRRMNENPNFYHLAERSDLAISERLSEELEKILEEPAKVHLSRIALHYGMTEQFVTEQLWPQMHPGMRTQHLLHLLHAVSNGPPDDYHRILSALVDLALLRNSLSDGEENWLLPILAAIDLIQLNSQGITHNKSEDQMVVLQHQLGCAINTEELKLIIDELQCQPTLYDLAQVLS